ncbi:MAG: thiamine phosphate synthase [Candidatus Eisenbacteria bacterium]|uniref:Thiamine-phosphate synthase n=1 Tax=Eiseniibacteriota bacterium TaxID=2212470 RepID=A0A937XCB4_UNCEI|nr:thiamine phosphate synthase [Candidatus Eisenbacteria bacterium]
MRGVGRLHVLVGSAPGGGGAVEDLARLALRGGADVIQLREKRRTTRERIAAALALSRLCREAGARLVVNDRLDIAIAADAGGVHLGIEDLPISVARALLGPDRLIGASARTAREAEAAMWAGADYIGAGPVYATGSKADAGDPIGVGGLAEIAAAVEIPVVAIGGITVERVGELLGAGAWGIALIEAVAQAPDPEGMVRLLRGALQAKQPGGEHAR